MSNLRQALQSIYDEHGFLTPALVVEVARDKKSPLHPVVFKLTDKEAAEAFRLVRAQELIRSFRIVYRAATDTEPAKSIREWQTIRADEDAPSWVYRSAQDVADDPFLTELVLREMKREWEALHRRYAHFAEFVQMVRESIEPAA